MLKNHFRFKAIMSGKILFRAIIEVLGKPREHVDASMKGYLQKLRDDKKYTIMSEVLADLQKQENSDLWMVFAELEIKTSSLDDIINFCFDYMPSIIEILEPAQLTLSDGETSNFLNDMQAKLHYVDMLAKQLKTENDSLKINLAALLKNYITVLLGKGELTSQQLSKLTGVEKDKLEDFLDKLIDEGRIDLKDKLYFLKKKEKEE